MTNITIERAKLALTDAKRSAMLMHNSEGHEVVCIEPNLWKQLRKAIEDLAAPVQEPLMVDIHPPTTQRDRWMYEQGRLAERDPRSHTTTPAAQPAYTKEDIDRAFSAGIAEGEKLGIEAQPAPVQEPVGYLEIDDIESQREYPHNCRNVNLWHEGGQGMVAIYTAPPAQPAVPLTDEVIVGAFLKAPYQIQHVAWFAAGVRFAEAKHRIAEKGQP